MLKELGEVLSVDRLWETKMSRKALQTNTNKLAEMSGKLTAIQMTDSTEHTDVARKLLELSDTSTSTFDVFHLLRVEPAKFVDERVEESETTVLHAIPQSTMSNILVTVACEFAKSFSEEMVRRLEKLCSLSKCDHFCIGFTTLQLKEGAQQQHSILCYLIVAGQ